MKKIKIVAKDYFHFLDQKVIELENVRNIDNYYLLQILPFLCSLVQINYEMG